MATSSKLDSLPIVPPTDVTYGQVAGNDGKYPVPDQPFLPFQVAVLIPELESALQVPVEHAPAVENAVPGAPLSPLDTIIVIPLAASERASLQKAFMTEADTACSVEPQLME